MQQHLRVLAISLVAVLSSMTVACSAEGTADDTATEGKRGGTTTVAIDDRTTTTVEESEEPRPVNDEARPYIEALKRSLHTSNEEEGDALRLTDDQIDCMAPPIVEILDVERMKANGVTPADLESDEPMDFSGQDVTEEEAQAFYDTFGQCDVNFRDMMLADLANDEESDPAYLACMEEALTEENVRLIIVGTMVVGLDALDEYPDIAPVMADVMGCDFMSTPEDE